MELTISTGSFAVDEMLRILAMRFCRGFGGSIHICDDSHITDSKTDRLIVFFQNEDYLRSDTHLRLQTLMGEDYFPLPFPISIIETEKIMSSFTQSVSHTSLDKTFAVLNVKDNTVTRNGETATLTEKESELLRVLILGKGVPISRESLRERLWCETDGTNAPDVYISYLRKKLTPILGEGFIVNIRGKGYLLKDALIEIK